MIYDNVSKDIKSGKVSNHVSGIWTTVLIYKLVTLKKFGEAYTCSKLKLFVSLSGEPCQ